MVSSMMVIGSCRRCITLAVEDDLALEQWIANVEKASAADDSHVPNLDRVSRHETIAISVP